jgi:hypothetical protein
MLIAILVAVIIFGLLFWLVDQLPMAAPWKLAAKVILVVIALLYFVQFIPGGHWRGFCG